MRNIVLILEYDGRLFHGWQSQANAAAVYDIVKAALCSLGAAPVRLAGASRTDAGVHAAGQVANFYTKSGIPAGKFAYALNSKLPDGIACSGSSEAAPGFHARFSAVGKTYSYTVLNRRHPSALSAGRAWHVPLPLDIGAMREAAGLLVGEHDFRAFMSTGSPVSSTVRTIYKLEVCASPLPAAFAGVPSAFADIPAAFAGPPGVSPLPADFAGIPAAFAGIHGIPAAFAGITGASLPHGDFARSPGVAAGAANSAADGSAVRLLVEGNGFLYNMVRIIAGTLVYVGQGKLSPAGVAAALSSGDRTAAGKTAPPHGLCLERVMY